MRARYLVLMIGMTVSAGTAHGDPGALVVAGKSTDHNQLVAQRAISDALRTAGWDLPDKPLSKSEAGAVGLCFQKASEPPECVFRVVHDRGVHRVAFVSIDPDPSKDATGLQVTARIVVADVGSVMTATHFCEHCTDDTIASSAVTATEDLLDRLAVESGRTVMTVKSTPQAARFSVDGTFSNGATDSSINIKPGRHTVTIEHDGYLTETRTIDAVEGKTAVVSVTLRAIEPKGHTPPSPPPNPGDGSAAQPVPGNLELHPHRSLVLPVSLVVVGGVAVVGGVVTLGFNEGPQTAPRGQVQRARYYPTTIPGVTAIVGGVVIAGVGGVLWWKYTHSNTAPAVAPVVGGAVVGLTGSF